MTFMEMAAGPRRPAASDEAPGIRLARDLSGYLLVSAVAFAVDCGLLVWLHRGLGWGYLAAGGASFSAGIAVVWSLCIAVVFRGRRRLAPGLEVLGFIATGLAGLLVNQAALAAFVSGLGAPPELAKVPAAGLVFGFNFLSRRTLLFRTPSRR